jgi:hypothetical protein
MSPVRLRLCECLTQATAPVISGCVHMCRGKNGSTIADRTNLSERFRRAVGFNPTAAEVAPRTASAVDANCELAIYEGLSSLDDFLSTDAWSSRFQRSDGMNHDQTTRRELAMQRLTT